MKPLIFILFTFLSLSFANAQKNYQETLTSLVKNSENDFVDILGEKKGEEDESVYFSSKIKFNIGEEFILQSIQTKASIYVLSADYQMAKDLEREIKKFIIRHYSKTPYRIIETKDNDEGLYTIEVRKESDIEATIILQVGDDSNDNSRFLMLSILGNEMKN